jgi:hypothetical protein
VRCRGVRILCRRGFVTVRRRADPQLKKVAAERGEDALTPQQPRSWLGMVAGWMGLKESDLSIQTCLHAFCTR